jgi:uncharacterized protein YeaO (DUF488 family)
MVLRIKRVYDEASSDDGYRILIDGLWSRGISKSRAKLDLWFKEIAPSPSLREWFNHDPEKFKEFSARYETELDKNPATAEFKKIIKQRKAVTLLYGAKDLQINHAIVLRDYLG